MAVTIFAAVFFFSGCAHPPAAQFPRPFSFYQDTLAFTNELLWQYETTADGRLEIKSSTNQADYFNRCFPMVLAVRKFQYHARFDGSDPAATNPAPQIEAILSRGDYPSTETNLITLGGANLREFSQAHEQLIKANAGGRFESYFQRGNWRVIWPFTRFGQKEAAIRFSPGVPKTLPIIHIIDLPRLNHALLVYGFHEDREKVWFHCYDPNDNANPRLIWFDKKARWFYMTKTPYFPGGRINLFEVYRNFLY